MSQNRVSARFTDLRSEDLETWDRFLGDIVAGKKTARRPSVVHFRR